MQQIASADNTPDNPIAKPTISRSWKTTVIGLVIALSGFVAFTPKTFGGEDALIVQVCKYITLGGLAGLGITAKDFNVSNNK